MYVAIVPTGTGPVEGSSVYHCNYITLFIYFFACLKSPSYIHTQTKIQNSVDTDQIAPSGQIV